MAVAIAAITCSLIAFVFIGYERVVLVPRATQTLVQWSQVLAGEAASTVAAGHGRDMQSLLAALAAQPEARWAAIYSDQATLASYVRSPELRADLPATAELAGLGGSPDRIVTPLPAAPGQKGTATLVVDYDRPRDVIPVLPLALGGLAALVLGLVSGWLTRDGAVPGPDTAEVSITIAPDERAAMDALTAMTQDLGMAGGRNADTPMFDHEAWLTQLDGDTGHMRLFADAFMGECDQLVKEVGEVVARRDYQSVERLANGLHATLLTVFATLPAHAAQRLATLSRNHRAEDIDVTYAALVRATDRLREQMAELMVGVQVA